MGMNINPVSKIFLFETPAFPVVYVLLEIV
jgi:hypothetical protein